MPGKPGTLIIEVIEIKGRCPVYRIGDSFRIRDGFILLTERPLCMHSLASLMPYYVALSRAVSPVDLGLARGDSVAYVQCLDPCHLTGGGTVVFAIKSEGAEERTSKMQGSGGEEERGSRGAGEQR